MRSTVVSLSIIGLALSAIIGGYASGVSNAPVSPIVKLHPAPSPSVHAVRSVSADAPVADVFSDDEVVIDRPILPQAHWVPASLSVVVGLCGDSAAIDGAFLRLGMPVALDVDPHARDAERTAKYVTQEHQTLFIHVGTAPSQQTLVDLRNRFGQFAGVASRTSEGMPQALNGTGLVFFDERGDADNRADFETNGVQIVQRDTTVDDRTGAPYVRFMFERAAMRSLKAGRMIVLMRPLPSTLAALTAFAGTRSAEMMSLTQRP
jgi:polysaccharide deacetylase 2 family uncharacterized protein YibQ